MISTFDLTLLGCLVFAGGLLFLRQGKWPHFRPRWLTGRKRPIELTVERRVHHDRSTAIAGARWLTLGALTLFLAYFHGPEEGYFFGPLSDVMFHVVFVATCWAVTAFRIKQAAERAIAVTVSDSSSPRTSD